MKKSDYNIPEEIRSNRSEDLFKPCWIVKTQRSDSVEPSGEQGWISLVVFEDSREMLELIGEWGGPSDQRSRFTKARHGTVNAT